MDMFINAKELKRRKEWREDMWNRSLLYCVSEAKKRGICLYGAGYWGNVAYQLFSLFNVTPVCYCDDDDSKVGKEYNGSPVLSLQEAVEEFPTSVYIVCIDQTRKFGAYNRSLQKNMLNNLKIHNVYDSNSELRLPFYLFLLDINGSEGIQHCKKHLYTHIDDKLFWWNNLKNLAIISNMSNSGVWFFTQLLDMHSHVLCLPFSESFEDIYVNRLQYLEDDELIIEMAAQMLGYFKSDYVELKCVGQHKFQNLCVDKNGVNLKEVYIEPLEFVSNLYLQFKDRNVKLHSYGEMLKIYFSAYNNCLQKRYEADKNYWMIYDLHKPYYDITKEYDFLATDEFDRIENLIVIREPVQHCFSWVKRMMIQEKNNAAASREYVAKVMKSELGINIERKKGYDNLHVVKFEDVKNKGNLTLRALCGFLDIPYEESMMKTTLNGIEVYFPANTKDGIKYITGFDTAASSQKDFSEILTPWDEARLNIIYSAFKKALGYEMKYPFFYEFEEKTLEDILKEDFKFALLIQNVVNESLNEEEQYDVNTFIKELFMGYVRNYDEEKVTYYDYIGSNIE